MQLPTTHVRNEATTEPVNDLRDLELAWRPDMTESYRAYAVRVTAREGGLLSFRLLHQSGAESARVFTVNVAGDTHHVWPDLPSTAQLAAPGQYGFLLLTDDWASANALSPDERLIGGGKFPPLPALTAGEGLPHSHVRAEASTAPVDTVDQLKTWWNPDTTVGFRFWRVKVTARSQEAGRDLLSFRLCNAAAILATEYTVDLAGDVHHVWPMLPSSAVKAAPGQFGFLLLTDLWAVANGVDPREGGGKFPPMPAL